MMVRHRRAAPRDLDYAGQATLSEWLGQVPATTAQQALLLT
jgi:hypothetical protein